ncbi:MAG: pyruvate kinase alpha/beta domain-containing protein [Thermodesulfovibrionales bacterium]
MQRVVTYFERSGKDNTEKCLEITLQAINEQGYRHVVVASTTGETGLRFSEALKGLNVNLVVITHSAGFKSPNQLEMPEDIRKKIIDNGAKVFTGTMITHSLETAFSQKFQGLYPTLIVAQSLRRFGEGPKVCIECVMMATDAGLIPEGEEVLAIAGTAYGADTVMVIRSAASKRFLDLKVLEILAKPRA